MTKEDEINYLEWKFKLILNHVSIELDKRTGCQCAYCIGDEKLYDLFYRQVSRLSMDD